MKEKMKGKISSGKVYTGVFLFLYVWIGMQLVAPVVAPGLGMAALLTSGVIVSVLFLCLYLPAGKQKIIPAALLAAVLFTGIYFTGWERMGLLAEGFGEWLGGRQPAEGSVFGYEMLAVCLTGVVFIFFSLAAERIFILKELTGAGLVGYLLVCMERNYDIQVVTVSLILFFVMAVVAERAGSRGSGKKTESRDVERPGKASPGRAWERFDKASPDKAAEGFGKVSADRAAESFGKFWNGYRFSGSRIRNKLMGSKTGGEEMTDRSDGRRGVVYLLPFLLLFLVGLLFLPRSKEPYDWQIFKEIYRSARSAVIILMQNTEDLFNRNREGFGLPVSGFSGGGELGGGYDAEDGNREQMRILLTSGRRMPVYLTGNVFDTFNGESWQMTGGETADDHFLDQVETLYAVERYDGENRKNYLYSAMAEITYTDLRTEFLFAPQKTRRLTFDEEKVALREKGGQWSFLTKQGYGTDYTVSFMQMNLYQPFFSAMLEREGQYPYGENVAPAVLAGLEEQLKIDLPEAAALEEILKERAAAIQAQYTVTPGVSAAVSEFIRETVSLSRTDYERCKAIEAVLNGSGGLPFRYTSSPGEMPENKQFPDYFLLESREGYCTYYATAFILMVRELGIPARYVQGFCVNDKNLGGGTVSVTNGMAHAWPEVYFAGVGWIPFEPTPGYGAGRYRYWEPVWGNEGTGSVLMPLPEQPVFTEAPLSSLPAVLTERPEGLWQTLGLMVLVAVAAAGGFLILLDKGLRRRAYRRYTPEEKMKTLVRTNLRFLRFAGFRLDEGETIGEFGRRVGAADGGFPLAFIGCFEAAVYGNSVIDEEMLTAVLKERRLLFDRMKERGKWRYYRIRMQMMVTEGVGYEY